ncbi:MAG: cupin [Chloroflexi bacterium]|nr:MAG: cupin [Chloroflexota bacterium]MBL1196295.1 cupin [Chloroflexota bacterium]NOH13590.1 cupin domain-containing protein [Chloroflexota bacterium]
MTNENYLHILDLVAEADIPKEGILTRSLHNDDQTKVILFAFDTDQELSEHTASMPAILHIVKGDADLTLGEDSKAAQAGTWVHMPANLPHSVMAKTPLVMLLYLLKG